MVLDKQKLINHGFLSFNLEDIDQNLYNELYNNFNKLNRLSSINRLRYDCTIDCNLEKFYFEDYCKKLKDEFNITGNHKAQSWLFSSSNPISLPNPAVEKIYKKIIGNLYPEYANENLYLQNKLDSFDLTLYEKNDFIEPHNDGIDPQRLCVILIYLNDDYQDGFGGELIIENHIKVTPIFGNIAILDFTANNPIHSVNHVLDDEFKRFAFIKFFYKEKTK